MRYSLRSWFGARGGKLWLLVLTDILAVTFSFAVILTLHALVKYYPELKSRPDIIRNYVDLFLYTLPLLLVFRIITFGHFGLYRSGWRYAGLPDALNIIKATLLSSIFVFVCVVLTSKIFKITWAPSVFLGDWILLTAIIGVSRFSMRIKKEFIAWRQPGKINILIVGAGSAGVMLLRELISNSSLNYFPRGFVDDARDKQGMLIQGVPVVGTRKDLPTLIHTLFVEEVFIAIPSASGAAIREIIEMCNTLGVKFKTLPSVTDIMDGRVTVSDLRDVDIMDILRREPVELETEKIRLKIRDSVVLVTGGGGSIGSELCRQIALYRPRELILIELSEFNLYKVDMELRRKFPGLNVFSYIANIKNESRLRFIFEQHSPQIVFHAAAYKHVPIMEVNPVEAVLNNVKGTILLAQTADKFKCQEFIQISTDKAVRPTSIMGATKRISEKYVQSLNTVSETNYISVRFGNVLDSSGSVLPLFKEQIIRGGPVTVTHPEVTRYFMLIPEAAQLVLEAATMGTGGEIFILNMGEPVRILDLARNLIQLMGKQPNRDIDIIFTGLRPGEKLHEELVYEGNEQPTHMKKILYTRANASDYTDLEEHISDLIAVATVNNVARIHECLREIVPEYRPTGSL